MMRKSKNKLDEPSLSVSLNRITVDNKQYTRYAKLCGFEQTEQLPATFLHLVAFPLHMTLLVNKQFPYPLLGLVHISNSITQFRPIHANETFNISCSINDYRHDSKGTSFDIVTNIHVENSLVWQSTSTMLHRKKAQNSKKNTQNVVPKMPFEHSVAFHISSSIGRAYAKISGDRNPIHLFALTAKLFGFKQAIAHGMWSKAYCLAHLEKIITLDAFKCDVVFKRPLLIPSNCQMSYQVENQTLSFELSTPQIDSQHLTGTITPLI